MQNSLSLSMNPIKVNGAERKVYMYHVNITRMSEHFEPANV